MCCAIWYYLYNLKNWKNTHRGVLLLRKVTLLHWCFSRFLNCANGVKSCNASHMDQFSLLGLNYAYFFEHLFEKALQQCIAALAGI